MAVPVLGSSMYGAWNTPRRSTSSCLFIDPRPHDFIRCGISSSTSFSRTSLQNGEASYEYTVMGFSGMRAARYLLPAPMRGASPNPAVSTVNAPARNKLETFSFPGP